jgi:hypothetical protein
MFGRYFIEDDFLLQDESGNLRPIVVVLAESIWKNAFGGDREILGKVINISGQPKTVIGIAPDTVFLFRSFNAYGYRD